MNYLNKLVEKQIIKPSDSRFHQLDDLCIRAKKLYNRLLYLTRHSLFDGEFRYPSAFEKEVRQDQEYPDYRNMLDMASAQQVIRQQHAVWLSYFRAHADWKKHPDKYTGEPKIPKYIKQDGRYPFTFTAGPNANYSAILLPSGVFRLPKKFNGLKIQTACYTHPNYQRVNEIKIVSKKYQIEMFVTYTISIPELKLDNNRYLGIDIGLDNLAACVTNDQKLQPFVINGKSLKSINQYYNKKRAILTSDAKTKHDMYSTHRIERLTEIRNRRITDYLHCASKYIVNYCKIHNINCIIVGKNIRWKTSINLGRRTNQNFTYIPHARFTQMIQYKAQMQGISVICTEESYTSGTSFLDDESPTKDKYNISRRIRRGLFRSNSGMLINSDINGAHQIIKKVVPTAFKQWDRGHVIGPVRISFS